MEHAAFREGKSIVLWYCLSRRRRRRNHVIRPSLINYANYAASFEGSADGSARLTPVSAAAKSGDAQGIAKENVEPGPTFGVAQRRP